MSGSDTGTRSRSESTAEWRAVGLMSGTSLDGVDAACCRVRRDPDGDPPTNYAVAVDSFYTEPYPRSLRARLAELCDEATGTVDEVCRLNVALGELFADAAIAACDGAGVALANVDVVGSHGQTIWHVPTPEVLPGSDRRTRSTLQIGDGSVIAQRTATTTASDFRTGDVAAGGHGAPLAPFFDLACLSAADEARALQNVGGIGNCTIIPEAPGRDDVTAFDTGPGTMVIDAAVELLTDGAATYDEDGRLAARGSVDETLLEERLAEPYFASRPPKTTGRERFGRDYAREFVETARERGNDDLDVVATATALTARSIADAYDRFADPYPDRIVVSGGGANNPTLLSMLETHADSPVERSDALGVDPDAKEAALFALLGVTAFEGVPNNVPTATGADRAVTLGKISRP